MRRVRNCTWSFALPQAYNKLNKHSSWFFGTSIQAATQMLVSRVYTPSIVGVPVVIWRMMRVWCNDHPRKKKTNTATRETRWIQVPHILRHTRMTYSKTFSIWSSLNARHPECPSSGNTTWYHTSEFTYLNVGVAFVGNQPSQINENTSNLHQILWCFFCSSNIASWIDVANARVLIDLIEDREAQGVGRAELPNTPCLPWIPKKYRPWLATQKYMVYI